MVTPYKQVKNGNEIKRSFSENVENDDLVWHRDKRDRLVTVVEGKNWFLQMDNELPILLETGKEYFIPKEKFHRVIKGNNKLKINIKEF